jgi:hypothetical protein
MEFSATPARAAAASASLSTDAQGNVVCPTSNVETCATFKCGKGEVCLQQAQTATTCARLYCAPNDELVLQLKPIGGIVGGTVGGVVALAALAAVLYWFVWRPRHAVELADEDIVMSGIGGDDAISNMESMDEEQAAGDGPVAAAGDAAAPEKRPPNKRLSTYESFTRPQARYQKKVQNRSINPQQRQRQMQQQRQQQAARSVYLDPNNPHRNSMATTVSTTNASNILPIAYIPGVTVRPTKNNTRSIYLYETELVFLDLNTIENASIVGARAQEPLPRDATMTAIKAQPRLVNVERIEEEEDEEGGGDSDSDVDSDIGEIVRATSVRKPARPPLVQPAQPHALVLDVAIEPPRPRAALPVLSGLVLLDVDIIGPGLDDEPLASPFCDPQDNTKE